MKQRFCDSYSEVLSLLWYIVEKSLVDAIGLLVKTNEEYRLYVSPKRSGRSDGNLRCKFLWKSVDTSADGWKSDTLYAESVGNLQRPAVTRCKQFLFGAIQVPWSPDRPANRMTAGGLYCFALIERASSCTSTTFVCCCISRNKDM